MKTKSITERPSDHSGLKDLRRITFARPARWAPLDSMYARYLLNSRNSSMEGLKVMILQLGFSRLSNSAASMMAGMASTEKRTRSSVMNYYTVKVGDHFSQMACKLPAACLLVTYQFLLPSYCSLISLQTAVGERNKKLPLILPLLFLPTSLHTCTGTHAQMHEVQDGSLIPVQDTHNHLEMSRSVSCITIMPLSTTTACIIFYAPTELMDLCNSKQVWP